MPTMSRHWRVRRGAGVLVPAKLVQQHIFRGVDVQDVSSRRRRERDTAAENLLIDGRPAGDKKVHFHGGVEVDDVDAQPLAGGAPEAFRRHVEAGRQTVEQRIDVLGSKVDGDVSVLRGTRLTCHTAGQRSANGIAKAQRLEHACDVGDDCPGIGVVHDATTPAGRLRPGRPARPDCVRVAVSRVAGIVRGRWRQDIDAGRPLSRPRVRRGTNQRQAPPSRHATSAATAQPGVPRCRAECRRPGASDQERSLGDYGAGRTYDGGTIGIISRVCARLVDGMLLMRPHPPVSTAATAVVTPPPGR